mmetsp:Transcript_27119/g.68236  ORF Transcript_27119/g.68236 Transcript_27119/m.68236 type:complete len:208 (-) Transcript_27119:1935-2558(-)
MPRAWKLQSGSAAIVNASMREVSLQSGSLGSWLCQLMTRPSGKSDSPSSGRLWRNLMRLETKRRSPLGSASAVVQSCQFRWVSWQYVLLLPPLVCPYSSPMRIIGTPCATSSADMRLRIWRCRRRSTPASPVAPSAPQFHDRLCCSPSLLSSPLASLCFSLYDTRSASVKPSCAVIKFTECCGRRPPTHLRPPLFPHQKSSLGSCLP